MQAESPAVADDVTVASDNRTSRAGPRMLFPVRSRATRIAAIHQFPAKASAGTAIRFTP